MSAELTLFPRPVVLKKALYLWDRLATSCVACWYAGDLRRFESLVGEISIVAIPGKNTDADLDRLVRGGLIQPDPTQKAKAETLRFFVPSLPGEETPEGMPFRIRLCTPENYGYALMYWTGCHEFATAMVTSVNKGGLRPAHLFCENSYVWQVDGAGEKTVLPIADEKRLFAAWGLPYIEPRDRSQGKVHELRRGLGLPYISIERKAKPIAPTHHRLEGMIA